MQDDLDEAEAHKLNRLKTDAEKQSQDINTLKQGVHRLDLEIARLIKKTKRDETKIEELEQLLKDTKQMQSLVASHDKEEASQALH